MFEPKNRGKIFTVCCDPASQSIGRGRISREGALDVRESRERRDKIVPKFSPGKQDKNVILACFFSLFWAGSLVVRESRHLRDRISDKNSKKRKKWVCFFFKSGRGACASRFQSCGFFHFFGRGKTISFGGGVQLQSWLGSDHPWAYTSMPQLCFGAKGVCYIEKKVAK